MSRSALVLSEPLYTFVKGQGWVASLKPFIRSYSASDSAGRVVTILDRIPEVGERGWYAGPEKSLEQIWREVTHDDYNFDRAGYAWEVCDHDVRVSRKTVNIRTIVTVIY